MPTADQVKFVVYLIMTICLMENAIIEYVKEHACGTGEIPLGYAFELLIIFHFK